MTSHSSIDTIRFPIIVVPTMLRERRNVLAIKDIFEHFTNFYTSKAH
jgi:hypothetical protein